MTLRSYLYVPGNRPELFDKALNSAADGVIFDLEDAVESGGKKAAVQHVVDHMSDGEVSSRDPEIWVRVNNRPELLENELAAVGGLARLTGISLPKVEDVGVLDRIDEMLPDRVGVLSLIESASGVTAAPEIAIHRRVQRLGLGEADLIADLKMRPGPDRIELISIRVNLVVASAAAKIAQPVGPVFVDIGDEQGLERSSEQLRRLGFGGRSAVHPNQLDIINRVFTPTVLEVEQAEHLVRSVAEHAKRGKALFVDDQGKMVDEAVVRSARHVIEVSNSIQRREGDTSG